ncbi:hypothetical protein [Gemmata sp.]|uniref:hypothetical protein n=1 Tax=Gemmata sp. TaxID=1914242 RepID=UPI003F706CDF
MTKSYRVRTLNRRCQLAKLGKDGRPLRDEGGNAVLDHDGQWFLHVSGGDHHDRKRVIPADPDAFFRQKAEEATAFLRSKGKNVTVTPEMVHREYQRRFTRPQDTYFPPGRPEEFSIVTAKERCVNWSHGGSRAAGDRSDFPVEEMSFLTHLDDGGPPPESPAAEAPTGRRRKGKAPQPVAAGPEDEAEEADLDHLM